jgi:regulator of sigma E protease
MDGLIMAAQMILGLSIMVGLHEFGHLLAAKAFGMKVEQYSIGFPPRIFKFTYGETVYSIGAVPLGGYVKISGMIDESLDLEKMKEEPKPWEFRSKPAWQRLIVMTGGIIMNIITGIVIFVIMTYSFGELYISRQDLNKNGIEAFSLGRELGLKTGDKILKINGRDYEKFDDLLDADKLLASNAFYTVERDGKTINIPIPSDFIEKLSSAKNNDTVNFVMPLTRFKVGEIEKGSGADSAGLKSGDRIVGINGKTMNYFYQVKNELIKLKGKEANVTVLRGYDTIPLAIMVSADGRLGFIADDLDFNYSTTSYTLLQAIPVGTANAFNVVFINAKAIGKIITGQLNFRKTMMGPIGIAKTFGGTWNWYRFWNLIGLLSMVLAFMNFLPIPALDGGHVMFLAFEIVSGKKPSDKFMEVSQKVGMVILLSLMVFVIFNDIFQQIF